MLRAILILIALVIVAALGATALGLVDFKQTQSAQAPRVNVEVNPIEVGTTTANVQVPTVGTTTKQVEVPTLQVGGGDDGNAQ